MAFNDRLGYGVETGATTPFQAENIRMIPGFHAPRMEVAPGEKQPWESNQKEHCNIDCLVVWNHGMDDDFPIILGIYFIIPTDEVHHFSEG
jgi:hypothetical protein